MNSTNTDTSSASRIDTLIDAFGAMSESDGPGVTRLAFTQLEREAHAYFTQYMTDLGLETHTDAAGNTLAVLRGAALSKAIGTGSHLDSVPGAGRYDGITGVVAAMEAARVIVTSGIAHNNDLIFVVFASEEGARFAQACNGSRIIAGLTDRSDLDRLRDANGITMAEAMSSVGLRPDDIATARWNPQDWVAFVELHVEQGGVLEDLKIPIGIVEVISGSTRLQLRVHGRASHTGGTPMHLRRDALTAAAECVLAAEELASDPQHRGTRITVGKLNVEPGSITTIPGEVTLAVDIRDVDSDRQRATAEELLARCDEIVTARGSRLEVETLADTSPVVLPAWIGQAIAKSATGLDINYRVMPSGASHDSQMINRVVPTGMIFVPSREGISHTPEEYTTGEQIAVGTGVLIETLLELDRQATQSGSTPT